MVVDAHVHLGPLLRWQVRGEAEEMFFSARNNGIDKLFCTHGEALLYDMETGNLKLYQLMQRYPEEILGYCSISSGRYLNKAVKEVEKCIKEYGMRGVKIFSWYSYGQGDRVWQSVDSEYMYPVVAKAAELKVPLLAHATPKECAELAKRFPEAIIIMAHMGNTGTAGGDWHLAISVAEKYDNIYLDTCGSSIDAGCLELAVERLGAERIVYGSDWPMFSFEFALSRINSAKISSEDKEKILGKNIIRILGLA